MGAASRIGLMTEPDHARRAHRQRGKQCLTVVGGIFGCALSQFLKLGREDIVHTERLREFLRNVLAMRAPRAEIDLLENAQVRFDLADLCLNVVKMFAAIDVPIQNGGAGVKTGWAGIVSRQECL